MRIAVLNDIHHAYENTSGIRRLREYAQVKIFTGPLEGPEDLQGFDAVIANRERTLFTAEFMEQVPELRIIAQTGNHAYPHRPGSGAKAGYRDCQGHWGFLHQRG